jgi:hypothetical protein
LQPIPIRTKGKSFLKGLYIWITSTRQFRVVRNWDFQLPNGRPKIRISEDEKFDFDGASIPRPFWWILSPVGLLLIPGLIHDYAYKHNKLIEVRDGKERDYVADGNPKLFWDALFRDVAIEVNGFMIILWVAWLILAIFGWVAWFKHRKQWMKYRLAMFTTILVVLATTFGVGYGVYILIF